MNTKELIASELASVIDSLDQEAILNLLETPKNSEMGDIAFPAFSLAKVERKAPQMIAAELAEKINSQAFEKVVATGPYVNFFLDKSAISAQVLQAVITEKNTMLTKLLANKKMLLSTCLVPISLNHFLLVTYAQLLSEIACHIFSKKSVIKRSRSTIWETGVNSLGC